MQRNKMAFLLEANIPSKVLVQRKCNLEHWNLCWTFLVSLTLFLIKTTNQKSLWQSYKLSDLELNFKTKLIQSELIYRHK